jgi:hypothetical protein
MSSQNEEAPGASNAEGLQTTFTKEEYRRIYTRSQIPSGEAPPTPPADGEHVFEVTFFPDQKAQRKYSERITLRGLAELIRNTTALTKLKLPWLKAATFGDKASRRKCLRRNANMLTITGVELDYDLKQMSFAEAVAIAKRARLYALLFPSPSYTEVAPKWRVVLPTSQPLPPEKRDQLCARANGIYGGIISPESFPRSQSFFLAAS